MQILLIQHILQPVSKIPIFVKFCNVIDFLWNACLDVEGGSGVSGKFPQDYPLRIVWKKGFVRLVLVAGILWMLLIMVVLLLHVWSCKSSLAFFSGMLDIGQLKSQYSIGFGIYIYVFSLLCWCLAAICNRDGRVFIMLDTMGFVPKPPHRKFKSALTCSLFFWFLFC